MIDPSRRLIVAQGTSIKLIPADLAFYLWLLQRQIDGHEAPQCPSDGAPEALFGAEYLHHYRRINGKLGGADRTESALRDGMSKAFFEQRKSRINSVLSQHLQQAAGAYLIQSVGKRPRTRYRVGLEKEQIQYIVQPEN